MHWFAPRRFGHGAGLPVRWPGWAFLGILVAGLAVAARLDGPTRWLAIAIIVVAALPIVAAKTEGGLRRGRHD